MRALVVAGARPNFMKVAPILEALRRSVHDCTLVHTGQHYDVRMSDIFFAELDIPAPDYHLGVGPGTHARQTARIMEAFEPVLVDVRPDWLVVVGDVDSTLACALVAAKLKGELGCRLAHVEAGLRSYDWRMPEETNRVLTDRLSDLLLTPSRDVHANLAAEGLPEARIVFVGNVMIDTLFARLPAARARDLPAELGLPNGEYAVATVHRPSNVDDPAALRTILLALAAVARDHPVVLPAHPRLRRRVKASGMSALLEPLHVLEPLGYTDMLSLTLGAAVALTDSGGLQEETTVLGVPCVTLREQTERPITILEGTNRLAPWPLTIDGIVDAQRAATRDRDPAAPPRAPEGWDGRAAVRICRALEMARLEMAPAVPVLRERMRSTWIGPDPA